MNKIPIVIDADTGIDDAVAIAVALFSKKLDVKLITSVYGNSSVESTTQNNLNLVHALLKTTPVAMGSGKNLSGKALEVSAHGKTGLGDYEFLKHGLEPIKLTAVEALHDVLNSSDIPVTILATGPLSNIAELLRVYPNDKLKIRELVISGGLIETLKEGDEPYLSFNVATDSVAFREVLDSGVKMSVVPSNLGHEAYLDWREVYKTKTLNRTGAMFEEIFRSYKDRHVKNGIATHDLCALLFISDPIHFEKVPAKLWVDEFKGLGVMKFEFNSSNPNSMVAVKCNIKKIKTLYFKALKRMPK